MKTFLEILSIVALVILLPFIMIISLVGFIVAGVISGLWTVLTSKPVPSMPKAPRKVFNY